MPNRRSCSATRKATKSTREFSFPACSPTRARARTCVMPCCFRAPKRSRDYPSIDRTGALDLGAAEVFRKGRHAYVIQKNPRHLNAEDDTTHRRRRNRRRSGHPRSADPDRRAARRLRARRQIRRQTHARQRHQSHPSVLRQGAVHLVPAARPGHRQQILPRRGARRHDAGRRERAQPSRNPGSPRSNNSPSAATASTC